MTTQSPSLPHPLAHPAPGGRAFLAEIGRFWREFFAAAFNPYHPERHYMRGPGPACAAKQAGATLPSCRSATDA